ncbi:MULTISPECIES: hypothetical protein [Methylobacterium]|uniref:PRC-barrel domain-containing protein n=1 Tax=Methylobacterium indicum TaxID=1775910 RepID=A0ABR5HHB2_9HYPH|nr:MULTISPECIES: hypothetical protein [Methylobacterium]KMO19339.1 hypothetical protein QR78_13020 [Methylobacterium indicum]KMO26026.1 hypothetical protein QR79_04565 [Methylobacterium indicum]QRE76891.1 hypothetical protein F1D61_28065 [Methylobacterium aquaticum]
MSARPASGLAACLAVCLVLALSVAAQAQTAGPSPAPDHMPVPGMTVPDMAARAARRFPQPVRVGDLAGRLLLQPEEAQPVLGRVTGLVRRGDAVAVVVRLDGALGLGWLGLQRIDWSGFGPRLVAVPVEAVALLGEHVALMGLTSEGLRALPSVAPDSAAAIPPDATIRVGIVRPFH